MIKLNRVSKSFELGDETITVLDKINIEIKKSGFVSIRGPSGSGKSTLMHLIGLLDSPTKGLITINNTNISNLSDEQISKFRNEFIGFVFQQFNLINKLTVLENIMLPTQYFRSELKFSPLERAKNLIKRFGINHRMYSFPNKISGGEQQRTAIARALIMDPQIILADEPTGNLDTKTGEIILNLLEELNKKDKKTVIIVTHEKHIADRTKCQIHIVDGEITNNSYLSH